MKFGVQPVFVKGFATNGEYVKRLAQVAEASGADSIWGVEHPIMAENYEPLYGYSEDGKAPFTPDTVMPDPLELLAFMAAATSTIKLGTGVMVLPLHSPIIIAKRVATLDALSGGRVELGVGLGWQREEYDAVHVPYHERGKRMDEIIDAMRALWTQAPATYEGQFYRFNRVHSDAKPARPEGVTIVIGGSSEAAARRAGKRGNGFFPYVISPEDLVKRMELIRATAKESGRELGNFEVTNWQSGYKWGSTFDLGLARAFRDAGVTRPIISAHEAGSFELADIERFFKRYRDEVVAKL